MGDLRFVGGSNIEIKGFGLFDGKYVIDKATHTISGGYTTKLDLSMGKEAKKEVRSKKKKQSSSSRRVVENNSGFVDEVKRVYKKD